MPRNAEFTTKQLKLALKILRHMGKIRGEENHGKKKTVTASRSPPRTGPFRSDHQSCPSDQTCSVSRIR
jgi:hypothetical protein